MLSASDVEAVPRQTADEHRDRRENDEEYDQGDKLSLLHSNPFPGVPHRECGPLHAPYAGRFKANPSEGVFRAAIVYSRPMSSSESVELVLRGYRAFVAGDFNTIVGLLAPDIEWYGADGEGPAGVDEIRAILSERFADGYRIELERCVGKGNEVLLAFRAAGVEKDALDDRPLQTRRYYTIGRYWAIAAVRDDQIARVQDYPSLTAALDALGVAEHEI